MAVLALVTFTPARTPLALPKAAAAATASALTLGSVAPTAPPPLRSPSSPRSRSAELPPPGPDEPVRLFNRRTGTWDEGLARDVPKGGEMLHAGRLLRASRALGALQWIRDVDVAKLGAADATYDPAAAHRSPEADDVVFVLGEAGYHTRLEGVRPGERVAFQGRVYETRAAGVDGGEFEVRDTGTQRNRVTRTYTRRSPTLVDLTIRYPGNRGEATLTGTPEHPFFVPARGDYVPMGELGPGTVLRTTDGSEATVAARSERHGDFEVHNLEVEHAHNYFVSPPGSDGPGVLVHNTCTPKAADAAKQVTKAAKSLGREAQKGIRSLEKRIVEHEQKLAEFKANPTVRPGMEGQPKEIVEAAQQSRIRHLEKEIQTFRENIEKLTQGEP